TSTRRRPMRRRRPGRRSSGGMATRGRSKPCASSSAPCRRARSGFRSASRPSLSAVQCRPVCRHGAAARAAAGAARRAACIGRFRATLAGMSVLIILHILSALVWVGGMFFAYLVLRPSAGPLEPPARLALWRRVFGRFFPWVWASVALLLATGVLMTVVGFGGFAGAAAYINVMMGVGIVMMLLFLHLYFAPWRRFQRALDG